MGHRPINWVKIFENKMDKTKKLMVNKVQLYPLSSLSLNYFYEKKTKNKKQTNKKKNEKERKKGGGPYFKQGSFTNAYIGELYRYRKLAVYTTDFIPFA